MKLKRNKNFQYQRIYGKISGYATAYNCVNLGIPFEESIRSALGFCDEVIVVDGESDDGTHEKLLALQEEYGEEKLQIYQNEFDWEEPGIDGAQKAFARALCQHEYLVQFDLDEVFHEDDYEKWKLITKKFPKGADILHLPIVELWGDTEHCTGRRHLWKWRVSRNKPEITHGINVNARVTDEDTGKVYAKKHMSDGCEYVNTMTYEMLPHTGFWNNRFDLARVHMQEEYVTAMNQVFDRFPAVWHTSWLDIPNKVKQLQPGGTWDRLWSLLYQEEAQDRFSGTDFNHLGQVNDLIQKLFDEGGEETDETKYKFKVNKKAPKLLQEWWNKKQIQPN